MVPVSAKMSHFIALYTGVLLLLMTRLADARARFYNWDVRRELRGAYKKQVVTINGASPGPDIQAHQGDIVFVRVTNGMVAENVAIRWVGIREIESLGSDGAEGVTPRPILPGEAFTYRFVVHRLGKFQYCSYYIMQKEDGLYGYVEVLPPFGMAEPFTSDYDKSIILDDRYYKSNYDWAAERKLLLIPGKGKFNCAESIAASSHPMACNAINPEYSHWRVIPGKTYRLNISSVTAESALSFQIEGHNLVVVEADGHYPYVNQSLIVSSGKTYSLLIKTDQDPLRNYTITTNIVGQSGTGATPTPLGQALLSYSPPGGPI